jgi:hypothetical protein
MSEAISQIFFVLNVIKMVKFTPEQAMKAQRGSGGMGVPFL